MRHLRPANLDLRELRRLFGQYGGNWLSERVDEQLTNLDFLFPGLDVDALTRQDEESGTLDDFAAAHVGGAEDIRQRFCANFYFGCEADDPITAWAFDPRLGAGLKPVFSSDIAHFDVVEMTEVLHDAYELVDRGLLTEGDFKAFTFDNAVELHRSMNPEFFTGTVVEASVASMSPNPR
jgi:hypothetical protein